MTDQTDSTLPSIKTPEFSGSLVRYVVVGLLIISLVPVLIVGLATYLRTQSVLREQTISQISTVAQSSIIQLEQFEQSRSTVIEGIRQDPYFFTAINDLLLERTSQAFITATIYTRNYLVEYIDVPTDQIFDQVTLINSDGNVLVSTNRALDQFDFSQDEFLKTLINTNKSQLVFNPGNLFPDKLVLLSTRIIEKNGVPVATVVGFSTAQLPTTTLKTSQLFFPTAKSYLSTTGDIFVSYNPETDTAVIDTLDQGQKNLIIGNASTSGTGANFRYQNEENQPVFSYIANLPTLESAFILEVPEDAVLGQVRAILPFLILLLLVIILITGALVSFSARSVVLPLTSLAKNAQTFATGDWSFRAEVNRRDEIGLLAYSFNQMVDQLTGYYHSLETKVEEKTKLLRTASDVAQNSISSPSRADIFEKMTQLLVDKLDFDYAGFYLVDSNEQNAFLTSAAGKNKDIPLPEKGMKKIITPDSLVGWTVLNKKPRVNEDLALDKTFSEKTGLLTSARSQLTIPVMNANTLYGILDIQNLKPGAFDQELIPIMSSFADQIASGLRNIQVLENAQVDLRLTTLLYQVSRQVSQAQTSVEVDDEISKLFTQSDLVSIFFARENDQVRLINLMDAKGSKSDISLRGFNIPLAKGLSKLSDSGILIIDDLRQPSDFSNLVIHFERRGCTSVALLPIYESGLLSSVLALGSRESEPLTMLQIQPYISFSEVIGTTLERIHLLDQLNQHVNELEAITTVGEASSTASDLTDLCANLFEKLKATIGEDIGFAIALNDSNLEKIRIPFYFDGEQIDIAEYAYSNDLITQTITSGNPIRHRDANAVGLFSVDSPEKRLPTRSFLGIPLKLGGETLGALLVLDRKDANRFTDAHHDLLTTLAPQISTSIRNMELLESQKSTLNAYDKERFLLNALLENVPDKIVIKDLNGKFIRVSKSYADSFNILNLKEMENHTETEFGILKPNEIDPDLQLLASGTSQLGEIEENQEPDGSQKWSLTSKIILTGTENSESSLLKISRDITDLINTQQIAEHRADQLITATEIARETSTGSMQIDATLKRMVELVKNRFNFYHSSIFLVDPIGQYAVLRESTGEAGARLKEIGHKLSVGSPSIVGQATGKVEAVVVNDVTKEQNYYPNPLLPETRSEMAIPLKIGSRLIGALDVQSEKINAFSSEDVNILQIMADQLSIAIENANLFSKTQKTLERHRLLHQITLAAGQSNTVDDAVKNSVQTVRLALPEEQIAFLNHERDDLLTVRAFSGYTPSEISELNLNSPNNIINKVLKTRKPIKIDDSTTSDSGLPLGSNSRSILAVPVEYGSRLIGILNVESYKLGEFDESDQEIITTLANNLASIIANIELLDQIRLQVERQRQLYEITSKIRRSSDIKTIMQTSLSEVCKTMDISRASIQLNSSPSQVGLDSLENSRKETGK